MSLFGFGETIPEYSIRVINECEARAGAVILLLVGLIAFSTHF
jgi:hypothetical protein